MGVLFLVTTCRNADVTLIHKQYVVSISQKRYIYFSKELNSLAYLIPLITKNSDITKIINECLLLIHDFKCPPKIVAISMRLKFANQITYLMRIDTHVTYGACQILIFCIVDMPPSFGINILFGQSEVNDMNDV